MSQDRRQSQRRTADRKRAPAVGDLPVPTAAPAKEEPPHPGAFSAQLIGQGGEKRGLKGGPAVLDAAKSAYLGVEFSGPDDRRPPTGRLGRKAI